MQFLNFRRIAAMGLCLLAVSAYAEDNNSNLSADEVAAKEVADYILVNKDLQLNANNQKLDYNGEKVRISIVDICKLIDTLKGQTIPSGGDDGGDGTAEKPVKVELPEFE